MTGKKYSRKENEEMQQELRLETTVRDFDSRGNVHGQARAEIGSTCMQDTFPHNDQNHAFFPTVSNASTQSLTPVQGFYSYPHLNH